VLLGGQFPQVIAPRCVAAAREETGSVDPVSTQEILVHEPRHARDGVAGQLNYNSLSKVGVFANSPNRAYSEAQALLAQNRYREQRGMPTRVIDYCWVSDNGECDE
jgi:hypothetical protein